MTQTQDAVHQLDQVRWGNWKISHYRLAPNHITPTHLRIFPACTCHFPRILTPRCPIYLSLVLSLLFLLSNISYGNVIKFQSFIDSSVTRTENFCLMSQLLYSQKEFWLCFDHLTFVSWIPFAEERGGICNDVMEILAASKKLILLD